MANRLAIGTGAGAAGAGLVVAVLLATGAVHVGSSSPRSVTSEVLDQRAVSLAAGAGDPRPASVTWVATDARQAETVVRLPGGAAPARPVFVLDVVGRFPTGTGRTPATHLDAVVDRTTAQVLAQALHAQPPGLTKLGRPQTDRLGGR